MKKIILFLLLSTISLSMCGQASYRSLVVANKSTLNGSTILNGTTTINGTFKIGLVTITANGNELNILDGVLTTAVELNKLVGIGTDTISTRAYARSVLSTGYLAPNDTIYLSNRINLKANTASPTFTGTVSGINYSMVGAAATSHSQAQNTITALSDSLLARYTKTQNNTLLNTKANTSHTQAQSTITDLDDSLLVRYTKTQANNKFAPIANPIFTGIQKVSTTDTLATKAYARTYGGSGMAMIYPSLGIALSTGSSWSTSIANNSDQWNTAYGWGNHSGLYLPIAGTATKATILETTRGIYGNNFDGSGALTGIIASTYGGTGNGYTRFSGPASTEKIFTLPNANATLARTDAGQTFTGVNIFTLPTITTGITPTTDGGAYIGTTALKFSGVFLNSGSVINFNNNDVTLTHSIDALTLGGGSLQLGTNNLGLTGLIGLTGSRVTKGWFTDLEITNTPTINGTSIATIYAPLSSPAFTGIPTAPTAAAGTNTTQVASTEFTTTADNLKLNVANPTATGTLTTPILKVGNAASNTITSIDSISHVTGSTDINFFHGPDTLYNPPPFSKRVNGATVFVSLGDSATYLHGYASLSDFKSTLTPRISGVSSLGTTSLMYSDLYLANMANINFNNGDVALTHKTDTLTLSGGDLAIPKPLIINYIRAAEIHSIRKIVGIYGIANCDFNFAQGANINLQNINLGAVIPAHARVTNIEVVTIQNVNAADFSVRVGNASGGEQFISAISADLANEVAGIIDATKPAAVIMNWPSATNVWFGGQPITTQWTAITTGYWYIYITYIEYTYI